MKGRAPVAEPVPPGFSTRTTLITTSLQADLRAPCASKISFMIALDLHGQSFVQSHPQSSTTHSWWTDQVGWLNDATLRLTKNATPRTWMDCTSSSNPESCQSLDRHPDLKVPQDPAAACHKL